MNKAVLTSMLVFLAITAYARTGGAAGTNSVSDGRATYYADRPFAGYVRAVDNKTGRTLWETKLAAPDNAQWVMIRQMKISGRYLVVRDEKDTEYKIDKKTGKQVSSGKVPKERQHRPGPGKTI